jgi:hypothetical protein
MDHTLVMDVSQSTQNISCPYSQLIQVLDSFLFFVYLLSQVVSLISELHVKSVALRTLSVLVQSDDVGVLHLGMDNAFSLGVGSQDILVNVAVWQVFGDKLFDQFITVRAHVLGLLRAGAWGVCHKGDLGW